MLLTNTISKYFYTYIFSPMIKFYLNNKYITLITHLNTQLRKGATQKIFLEFGLFFFYRNNNRQQPENCNRLLFFL